ncbi:MAG: choice-of-anchor D domain-containing protein [Patescibacteria group bacterium]|nr:choice-of-anchor D domain-containing protein [Patescibacteria group bacterium]
MKKILLIFLWSVLFIFPSYVLARPYAYVTNADDDSVSVIDTATRNVIKTISVGNFPLGVAVSPDRTKVYVGNYNGNSVSIIDVASLTVTKTISFSGDVYGIVFNPTGTKAYVSYGMLPGYVGIINVATDTYESSIVVGNSPAGLAINPLGTKLYVANFNGGDISVIDLNSNSVIKTISSVGNFLHDAVINSAGTRLYVASFDVSSNGSVAVIDIANDVYLTSISMGAGTDTTGLALNPTGSLLYATNILTDEVKVVNTTDNSIIGSVTVGDAPWGISSNHLGTRVYVANQNSNNISVIDALTNTVIDTIAVGTFPYAAGTFVEQQPIVSVSDSNLNFARTLASDESTKNVTISNLGTVNLNINQMSLNSDEFILGNDNCSNKTIIPQGNCTFDVIFRPQTSGSKTANITITSNDPEHVTTVVSLSGTSIYADRFVTRRPKSKQVLIEKNKNLYAKNLTLKFTRYPKKLKKIKYYLEARKYKKYLNSAQSPEIFLKKYIKLKNNFYNYIGKNYKIKFKFKYSQKEFKALKKKNSLAKEKNLILKYYDGSKWKNLKAELSTKNNTLIKYYTKLDNINYYFGIGIK